RARKFKPLHSSIEKNIKIVNKKFKNKIPEQKVDFVSKILLKIESLISINLISWFLIIFILVLNISIFMVIKMGKKKVILYLLFFSLLLSVFASATHLYRNQKQSNHNLAVIIEPNSHLRSGPGDDNTVLFTVYPGLEVKIMEKSREWVQISAFSEIAGWIERDSLTVI
ncbi:MAG: SH3 domain-containing protein, partial [Candidatus Aminicenantes bacterium]|nr:SH3 domain-containing protein [Candidatus Aminicenantes bacterium]